MVVTRLNANGSVDTSFASAGEAFVNFGGNDVANAMALQPDGKIVLVGSTDAVGSGDFAVARLNADGTPDTSFSGGRHADRRLRRRDRDGRRGRRPTERDVAALGNGDPTHDFGSRATSPTAASTPAWAPLNVAVDFGGDEFTAIWSSTRWQARARRLDRRRRQLRHGDRPPQRRPGPDDDHDDRHDEHDRRDRHHPHRHHPGHHLDTRGGQWLDHQYPPRRRRLIGGLDMNGDGRPDFESPRRSRSSTSPSRGRRSDRSR